MVVQQCFPTWLRCCGGCGFRYCYDSFSLMAARRTWRRRCSQNLDSRMVAGASQWRGGSAHEVWCGVPPRGGVRYKCANGELTVAVNLKVDSRLEQVRWNATVTGGAVVTELRRADGGCRGCWCVNLLPSRLVHGGEKMVLQNRGGRKWRRLPWRLMVAARV